MRKLIFISVASFLITFAGSLQAKLFVYEPFDYNTGYLSGNNLGRGMSGSWTDGPEGGDAYIYDQTAAVTPVVMASGNLSWDGVVGNLPTLPEAGSRFVGLFEPGDKFEAYRPLALSAGDMAAASNGVLWISAVWHFPSQNYGAHLALALTTDSFRDRGKKLDTTANHGTGAGDGIGAAGSSFNSSVNAVVFDNGSIASESTGPRLSSSKDNIVVLKIEFGSTDTVSAYFFTEDQVMSESAFNAGAVSTSYAIDENSLNLIAFDQNRGANAIDEIRIASTFDEVIGIPDPTLATVDAGPDWATWSGQPVQLDDDVIAINNDTGAGPLSYEWTAVSPDGVTVQFSDINVLKPQITITKPADDTVATVHFTLTVTQPGKDYVDSRIKIDAYDTSCKAAVGSGSHVITQGDANDNCVTDLEDLFEMVSTWLINYSLTEPVEK